MIPLTAIIAAASLIFYYQLAKFVGRILRDKNRMKRDKARVIHMNSEAISKSRKIKTL
jgi:hypothetical protein